MPNLGTALDITLADLEAGINNEENSGFILRWFSLNQAGTDNILHMEGGSVVDSPVGLKLLAATTRDDAATEGNALSRSLFDQTAGQGIVIGIGELSIEGRVRWVAATRQAAVTAKPLVPPADGTTITRPGFPFSVEIVGGDLLINDARATWFGGPHDSEDSGATASGLVNTRQHPDFLGCALPMDESHSQATAGSPIPRLRWGTLVEVVCRDTGLQVAVPLIDLGPSRGTGKALDLTEPAFEALGVPRGRGVTTVDIRVRNLAAALHPQSGFDLGGVSTRKPVDAAGEKILPVPTSSDANDLGALIDALKLPNFTGREILESITRSRGGVENAFPPASLYANLVPTLCLLQTLRDELGCPLHPTSTYRSAAYNRAVGGAARSQHMAFRAIDIQAEGVDPSEVARALRALRGKPIPIPGPFDLVRMQAAGVPFDGGALDIQPNPGGASSRFVFHGGIGEYATFVHVDCRGTDDEWS